MTLSTNHPRRMALPAAALAALLLAGCSSGNVGESWQCPLADAGTCDRVSAADPAVPDMDTVRNTALAEPLWRVRGRGPEAPPAQGPGPGPAAELPCQAACDGGFDPFAWLARLFGGETAEERKTAVHGPVRHLPPEGPAPAALPAETPAAGEAAPDGDDDLRMDEVVARIWIAPFVDAGGVYREASWVRAVLEPAGWRLGR